MAETLLEGLEFSLQLLVGSLGVVVLLTLLLVLGDEFLQLLVQDVDLLLLVVGPAVLRLSQLGLQRRKLLGNGVDLLLFFAEGISGLFELILSGLEQSLQILVFKLGKG